MKKTELFLLSLLLLQHFKVMKVFTRTFLPTKLLDNTQ